MNVRCYACIGGVLIDENICMLVFGQQLVVATPGRIELLSMDSKEQTCESTDVFHPQLTSSYVLSVTLPHDAQELSIIFVTGSIHILAKRDEPVLEGIKRFFVAVEKEKWKLDPLCGLFEVLTATQNHRSSSVTRSGRLVTPAIFQIYSLGSRLHPLNPLTGYVVIRKFSEQDG